VLINRNMRGPGLISFRNQSQAHKYIACGSCVPNIVEIGPDLWDELSREQYLLFLKKGDNSLFLSTTVCVRGVQKYNSFQFISIHVCVFFRYVCVLACVYATASACVRA
jgi:hypothetical protein